MFYRVLNTRLLLIKTAFWNVLYSKTLMLAQCSIFIPTENIRGFQGVSKWNIELKWIKQPLNVNNKNTGKNDYVVGVPLFRFWRCNAFRETLKKLKRYSYFTSYHLSNFHLQLSFHASNSLSLSTLLLRVKKANPNLFQLFFHRILQ